MAFNNKYTNVVILDNYLIRFYEEIDETTDFEEK